MDRVNLAINLSQNSDGVMNSSSFFYKAFLKRKEDSFVLIYKEDNEKTLTRLTVFFDRLELKRSGPISQVTTLVKNQTTSLELNISGGNLKFLVHTQELFFTSKEIKFSYQLLNLDKEYLGDFSFEIKIEKGEDLHERAN